ncbi:MAG: GNAT family N-acetyltransferase [Novosphingobium sp.]|nr:GNAT family N-acetyltransferase [Novosphingobium sp.]
MREVVDQIMAVMDTAFPPEFGEAWTRGQIEGALMLGNCHAMVIDRQGLPPAPGAVAAGFSLSRSAPDEEELLLFAVDPLYRGRGLGTAMLQQLAREAWQRGARRLLLEMRAGNPAESLYRRHGFEPIGRRPNYYRTPDGTRIDAITFACPLDY